MNKAERHLTLAWLVLVIITILSWSSASRFGWTGHWQVAAVIVLAFIKARIVFLDFMELRNAPLFLRLILEAWAVTECATLIALATIR